VVLGRRQGLAGEHRGVSWEAPGKVRGSGGSAASGSGGRQRALVGPVARGRDEE
jgi:hypothetical protein